MNKKIILILIILIFYFNLSAQIKMVKEEIVNNKLQLTFTSTLNYVLKKENNQYRFIIPEYKDESNPGDVQIPSQTVFISLPFVEKPQVKYKVIEKKTINAIPKFNPEVEFINNTIVYKKPTKLLNSKISHFNIKGYLWISDEYCIQIEINPAIFLSNQNKIELVEKFVLNFSFKDKIPSIKSDKSALDKKSISINTSFQLKSTKEKFNIKRSDEWIDYTKSYLKIGTAEDGIYRITKMDLENSGVNVSSINPRTFKMYMKGTELPIYVEGEDDLSFDDYDFIEFVGIRNMGGHHRELSKQGEPYNEYLGRYTDTTIYWLTWNGKNGKRVNISQHGGNNTTDTLDYYYQIDHYEKNNWFDFSSRNQIEREKPFWTENKTWHEGSLRVRVNNKLFSVNNVVPSKVVKLFAKFQDYASDVTTNAHYVTLGLNEDNYGDSVYFDKYDKVILKNELSSDLLKNGNNYMSINSMPTNASLNVCIFDWYEVEYPRYLIPIDNKLKFMFPFLNGLTVKNIKITEIGSSNYSLWKYGSNYKKFSLEVLNSQIIFSDSVTNTDKYFYADVSEIKKPKLYYIKNFKNLRSSQNKADYIAITHKKFISKVKEYVNFISQNYLIDTKVVDIDDIYDEFAYGFFNPEAIKDFLKSTHNYWQNPVPQYVVLIGGATYDYYGYKHKNFGIKRVINYVPSFGAPVSDIWFVTWDTTNAYIPQMNIGRIPVTSNEELDWYFEKHKKYLSQEYDAWNKRYLFFTGGDEKNPYEIELLKDANQAIIDEYIVPPPIGGQAEHFYKTVDPVTNFGNYSKEYVQNAIDEGGIFISYLGHSGTQTWDNSIVSPAQLMNTHDRYPIVSDFGCSTGKFAEPDVTSFSQLFVLDPQGQALSYIGNSSLGFLSTALIMPKLFYGNILKNGILNVGEAHKIAKIDLIKDYGITSVNQLSVLTNTLIGDPILNLQIPDKPNFTLTESDITQIESVITDLIDSSSFNVRFENLGYVPNDSLNIMVLHQYHNNTDTLTFKVEVPSITDSLLIKLKTQGQTGEHQLNVVLDYDNRFEEIYENDNDATITFYVFSSAVRPYIGSQFLNGVKHKLKFINPSSKPLNEIVLLEISPLQNFSNKLTFEIPFDTFSTVFSTDNLEINKRFWGRTRIKNDNNYSSTFSFINNASKYFLGDSVSFSSVEKEDIFYKNQQLKIDTTKIKFEVLSAGFSDGNTVLILRNSKNFVESGTIRGHYVTVFNDSTYEFVESTYFDLLSGGSETQVNYMNFLDTLSENNIVCFAIKDEGAINLNEELRNKIKEYGSIFIDSVQFRSSWAFIGKKGAVPGSMPEAFSHEGNGPVTVDTTISFLANKGKIVTNSIGPVSTWKKLIVKQQLTDNSNITYTPIGITKKGLKDTLTQLIIQNGEASLRSINGNKFPYLKFIITFNASSNKSSPILTSLGVDYDLVPELGINYQVVSIDKDSVEQGENVNLSFYVYNVGESPADSFKVKVDLVKPDNSSQQIFEQIVDSLGPEQRKKFNVSFNTVNYKGAGQFNISIDADSKILELYEDNNFYSIPFYVHGDTTKPSLNITFDGQDIFDGEYISATPDIKIEMNDPSLVPINDTSAVTLFLNDEPVYYSQNQNSLNITFSNSNPKVIVNYRPTLKDGEYTLTVFGKDASGNVADSAGVSKSFVVDNEAKLLNLYNYPNPFAGETHFTFKLTQIPDEIKIKIYTIAGRLVKQIRIPGDELDYDFNKIYWDGRDEDGDLLANGVYIYKVILYAQGKTKEITQKLAIVR